MKERSRKRIISMATLYITLIILVSAFVMQVGLVYRADKDIESVESSPSLGAKEQEMEKISAVIEVSPQNLDLTKEGDTKVFTVFIKLPEPYKVSDIEPNSVRCNGATPTELSVTEYNGGYLMAQFNTQDLEEESKDQGILSVKGELKDGKNYFETEKVLS